MMIEKKLNKECDARLKIAREIEKKCSEKLGREIIIVGSVSRGLADEDSDIEIEFLVDNIVSETERINWIKEIGGTEIYPYGAPIGDGSEWIIFKYEDYWIEAGWQKINVMEDNLKTILEGKVYTHDKLILAWVLKNAIFIRKDGVVSNLKEDLILYQDLLQEKIIMNTISAWTVDLGLKVRKTLAKRGDKIPLLERMILDIHRILRILFAVNKQWEPDWKWIKYILKDLEVKPANLEERIDSIICITNPEDSIKNCFDLIQDTLLLIPENLKAKETIINIMNNISKIN